MRAEQRREAEATAEAAREAYEEEAASQPTVTSGVADKDEIKRAEVHQELIDEYDAGGETMSAQRTLRVMAEDARYGLQRSVLDTVADIVSLVAMQSTDSYNKHVLDIEVATVLEELELSCTYTNEQCSRTKSTRGRKFW